MGLLGRLGRRLRREIEEAIEREILRTEDRLKGKLDKWEEGLYKKVTRISQHVKGPIITDYDAFKKSWEENAGDPIQSVFHFCQAVYNYCVLDKMQGEEMATLILAKTFLLKNTSRKTGFKVNPKGDGYLLEHMRETPRTIKSYFGGTPKNGYDMNPEELDMSVVGRYTGKTNRGIPEACITIDSGGKDHDTPLSLRRPEAGAA